MAVMASCQEEPVAKVLVLHLCRKLCRSLGRKMPDPTKVAIKAADKVFNSADFRNSLCLRGRLARDESWGETPRRQAGRLAHYRAVHGKGRNWLEKFTWPF